MPLACGWPNGIHTEDGWCDDHATTVHLVKVHDAPLVNPDAEPRVAVLTLCPRHGPLPDSAMVDTIHPDGTHDYWSTHCRHGNHDACNATQLAPGIPRRPAQCKTCAAPCRCACGHTTH